MPSLNVDLNYLEHPDTLRLVALLGSGAEVYPLRLWIHCGKYSPAKGEFKNYSAKEIENILKINISEISAIDALITANFLTKTEKGYKIPNWKLHQGHLRSYSIRAKKANRARWSSNKDSLKDPSKTPKVKTKESPILYYTKHSNTILKDKNILPFKLPKKVKAADFSEVREFLLKLWTLNGNPYPFSALEGKQLSRLLNLYGRAKTMALIEYFWNNCDDWTRTNLGRSMRGLLHNLPKLLDSPMLKVVEKKHEFTVREETSSVIEKITSNLSLTANRENDTN